MSELQHGLLLRDQGRLEEAEACFVGVLGREPENDFVHSQLALVRLDQEGRNKDALSSIDEAIRLQPNLSHYRSIRVLILCGLGKAKEALKEADEAVALDPEDTFAANAKASAFCELQRWADAERWARKALQIDPSNSMAANILTHTLRLQGKSEQNQAAVEQLLADDPNSALAHVNAGWTALRSGESAKAEEHFREALRLDPELTAAREGLLESFRARSWFYRAYLKYCFFMQRFSAGKQWVIIIAIFLVYRTAREALEDSSPLLASALVVLWLGFIMWIWLAPGIGNFLVYLDSSARLALSKGEKWHGFAVGGMLLLGILTLVSSLIWTSDPLFVIGFGTILSTVPASLAFNNESRAGRWVFGSLTGYIYLATPVAALVEHIHNATKFTDLTWLIAIPAIFGAILCTWLGNVSSLREKKGE